jgi:hypothetical protein
MSCPTRNPFFLKKSAKSVIDLSAGEKNGKKTGIR